MDILWADRDEIRELFYPTGIIPESLIEASDILMGAVTEEGDIAGVVAASESEPGTVQLSWLYVVEAHRREGVASALLREVVGLLSVPGAGCDEVVVSYILRSQSEALDALLKQYDFEREQEASVIYTQPLSAFAPLKKRERKASKSQVVPLELVKENEYRQLVKGLRELRMESEKKREVVTDPLYLIPEDREAYDPRLSHLLIDEKEQPAGCIFMTDNEGGISVEYLCVFPGRPMSDMIDLVAEGVKAAYQWHDSGDTVWFNAINKNMGSFLRPICHNNPSEYGQSVSRIRYI